jgi:hypothetical protein
MLNARDEFEVSYEKGGPDEWILRIMRRLPENEETQRLQMLLKQLTSGQPQEEIKDQAKILFQKADAKTIGFLEQQLIQQGVSREEVRHSLCDIHLEVLRDSLVAKRIEVHSPHPVHTLMEEHLVILETLKELVGLLERLNAARDFPGLRDEDLQQLGDIAHHLVESENHHQREEDVLFPILERHGITEPTAIMREDHEEFRRRKQRLFQIAQEPKFLKFADFKKEVLEIGRYLTRELESHIFKEDNILYQIALQLLGDNEWEEVKRECDKIGYCCFIPEDQSGK